jgi:hypothetical protein
MLRHAEMPKGSRRVPTVKDGFILGLPHGAAGRLYFSLQSLVFSPQPSPAPGCFLPRLFPALCPAKLTLDKIFLLRI